MLNVWNAVSLRGLGFVDHLLLAIFNSCVVNACVKVVFYFVCVFIDICAPHKKILFLYSLDGRLYVHETRAWRPQQKFGVGGEEQLVSLEKLLFSPLANHHSVMAA